MTRRKVIAVGPRADVRDQVAELKRGPDRDVLVFDSQTLWNDLLALGLVIRYAASLTS